MSAGVFVRWLGASVRRASRLAGVGRPCASCRLIVRHLLPRPGAPATASEDKISVTCQFCGTVFGVDLSGLPEGEREVSRLRFSYTLKDRYTDAKACALWLWSVNRYMLGGGEQRRRR